MNYHQSFFRITDCCRNKKFYTEIVIYRLLNSVFGKVYIISSAYNTYFTLTKYISGFKITIISRYVFEREIINLQNSVFRVNLNNYLSVSILNTMLVCKSKNCKGCCHRSNIFIVWRTAEGYCDFISSGLNESVFTVLSGYTGRKFGFINENSVFITVIRNSFVIKFDTAHIINGFLNFPLTFRNTYKYEVIINNFDCNYVNSGIRSNVRIIFVYDILDTERKLVAVFIIKINGLFRAVIYVTVLLPFIIGKIDGCFVYSHRTNFRNRECKICIFFRTNNYNTNVISAIRYILNIYSIGISVFDYFSFFTVIGNLQPLINYLYAFGNSKSVCKINLKFNCFSVISFLNYRWSNNAVEPQYVGNVRYIGNIRYVGYVRYISSEYRMKRYVSVRHFGIYLAISIRPTVNYFTVIIGYSCEELYVSSSRKKSSRVKLTVDYVLNLINTCKVNWKINRCGNCRNIKERSDKRAVFFVDFCENWFYRYCVRSGICELTVTCIKIENSHILNSIRNSIVVNRLNVIHQLVIIGLVFFNLVLYLLFSKSVKSFKSWKKLVIKNCFNINIIKYSEQII